MHVTITTDGYAGDKDKLPRRDSATRAMLPLYRRTTRFLSDPYTRMKKRALLASVALLVVLYVVMVGFATDDVASAGRDIVFHDRPGFQAPTANKDVGAKKAVLQDVLPQDGTGVGQQPGLRHDDEGENAKNGDAAEPPEPIVAPTLPEGDEKKAEGVAKKDEGGDAAGAATATKKPVTPASNLPFFVRLVLPLLAGFSFGFLGSVPIAGPTSAMVLKLGIQGKYQTAITIAFGGAISEGTYAGIAFWGFGSFLAGAKWLLPVSKVLGAIMFTIVGLIFLKSEVKSPLDVDAGAAQHKGMRALPPRDEILKNILMGLTMSGINPALLATYTGAIASVYGTGLLEFTLFLAFVFGIGVCCGVSTWFFILVSLLQKYKQSLKKQTIAYIMRGMGCFLLTLGVFCAKSSFEYFFWGTSETKV